MKSMGWFTLEGRAEIAPIRDGTIPRYASVQPDDEAESDVEAGIGMIDSVHDISVQVEDQMTIDEFIHNFVWGASLPHYDHMHLSSPYGRPGGREGVETRTGEDEHVRGGEATPLLGGSRNSLLVFSFRAILEI